MAMVRRRGWALRTLSTWPMDEKPISIAPNSGQRAAMALLGKVPGGFHPGPGTSTQQKRFIAFFWLIPGSGPVAGAIA